MAQKAGRSWKMERASVNERGKESPRSNKYSHSDTSEKPASGERERAWVGGYTRADACSSRIHLACIQLRLVRADGRGPRSLR